MVPRYYIEFLGTHGCGKTTLATAVTRLLVAAGFSVENRRRLHRMSHSGPVSSVKPGNLLGLVGFFVFAIKVLYYSLRIVSKINASYKKKFDTFQILLFNALGLKLSFHLHGGIILHDWGIVGRLIRYDPGSLFTDYLKAVLTSYAELKTILVYISLDPEVNAKRVIERKFKNFGKRRRIQCFF